MATTYEHSKTSDMENRLPTISSDMTPSLIYQPSKPVTIPNCRQHRHTSKATDSNKHGMDLNLNPDPVIREDADELSPLPDDLSHLINASSPKNSPPLVFRPRSQTIDASAFQMKSYKRTKSNPISIIPKDPQQPKTGSIGDIHGHHQDHKNGEDENEGEDDFFSELVPMRSRSHTCPDSILHKRKAKVRSLRRPSTPPPADLLEEMTNLAIPKDIEKEIDRLVKLGKS